MFFLYLSHGWAHLGPFATQIKGPSVRNENTDCSALPRKRKEEAINILTVLYVTFYGFICPRMGRGGGWIWRCSSLRLAPLGPSVALCSWTMMKAACPSQLSISRCSNNDVKRAADDDSDQWLICRSHPLELGSRGINQSEGRLRFISVCVRGWMERGFVAAIMKSRVEKWRTW